MIKSKEGGCLLFETNQKQVAPEQPDQSDKDKHPVPQVPKPEVPALLVDRGAKEPATKTVRNAEVVERTRPDLPADIETREEKVINWKSAKTASNMTRRINRAAFRTNAALLGVDIANELYEHWDEIETIEDVARILVPYAQENAAAAAALAMDIASGVKIGVPEMASIIGVPIVTRTADNLAGLLGHDTHFTEDVVRAEIQAQEAYDSVVPESLQQAGSTIASEAAKHGPAGVLTGLAKVLGGYLFGH